MKWIIFFIACLSHFSCTEEPIGQIPVDGVPPGTVSEVVIENLNGGAKITYDLPEDEDLLYVKAVYEINNNTFQATSSLYKNYIEVEGFGSTNEQTVELICVDKSGNESSPITTTIKPITPPYQLVFETLKLQEDFGGVRASWTNEFTEDMVVSILVPDTFGIYTQYPNGTFYSNAIEGEGVVRGFDPVKQPFAVMLRDRWGNYSDTIKVERTPLFEEELDKELFKNLFLTGDKKIDKYGWHMTKLWNNTINGNEGAHGYFEHGTPWPFTFDLGQTARLSRLIVNHRHGSSWAFKMKAGEEYEIWGCAEYSDDGDYSEWIKLQDCNIQDLKPSGLPYPDVTNEDVTLWDNGFEYSPDLDVPPIRYIRFVFKDNYPILSELTIYGQPVK